MRKPIKELEAYIDQIKVPMGLRLWSFEVVEGGIDEDAAAEIKLFYGQKNATIHFQPGWFEEWGPIFLRHVCVHELTHCFLGPLQWNLNNLAPHLAPQVFQLHNDQFRDLVEVAIDDLATVIEQRIPKPTFIKAKA